MRAMTHDSYGPLSSLILREVDRPRPGAGEVLIRARAAGLHIGDCWGVQGSPLLMRMSSGLLHPKVGIPGFDVAGRVVEVGERVTGFRPGDEVFGTGHGTCATYVRSPEKTLAHRPTNLSPQEAAAVPTSALAALHALRDSGRLKPKERVLINGASGGVGSFAVQIAKAFGAEVAGVCGPSHVELVRSLGADRVVDYTREDFTRSSVRYDLILDNQENRSLGEVRRVLAPRGTLILNSGTGTRGFPMLKRLIKPLLLSPFLRQRLRRYLSVPNRKDLETLKTLIEAGQVHPIIDRTYPLSETATALAHIEKGHAGGKVVINLD